MTRNEAFIPKDWQETGLAQVLVARHREDGLVDFAFFLVDYWCLGVKDVIHDNAMPATEFDGLLREYIPEEFQERIHPACAKKLIDGSIAYAEQFGFSPCRDYRKARKILSSVDPSTCPAEYTYGRDGKPFYLEGSLDTPERTEKVLSILEARCGSDGFDYELLDDEDDELVYLREELMEFLDDQPDDVPRFYQVSGMITALLLSPDVPTPGDLLEYLSAHGLKPADMEEAQYFLDLLKDYWNHLNTLILDAVAPDAPVAAEENYLVDIDQHDFEDEEDPELALTAILCEWAKGFITATEHWAAHWESIRTRPELAASWEVLRCWADLTEPGNWDKIQTAADSPESMTVGKAILTLTRALRKPLG